MICRYLTMEKGPVHHWQKGLETDGNSLKPIYEADDKQWRPVMDLEPGMICGDLTMGLVGRWTVKMETESI